MHNEEKNRRTIKKSLENVNQNGDKRKKKCFFFQLIVEKCSFLFEFPSRNTVFISLYMLFRLKALGFNYRFVQMFPCKVIKIEVLKL